MQYCHFVVGLTVYVSMYHHDIEHIVSMYHMIWNIVFVLLRYTLLTVYVSMYHHDMELIVFVLLR